MPLFQDVNGFSHKFFLQKDIPQEQQNQLAQTIAFHGGRIEVKVPRAGYVLIIPGTVEGERLKVCWERSAERPDRYVVPYGYVQACVASGQVLKPIFVDAEHNPLYIHIHSSIANPKSREIISDKIRYSGGDPFCTIQQARVILADPNTDDFHNLVKTYQGVPEKHIESIAWIDKCIESGIVVYTPMVYKNPGGRRAGDERTAFSDEDDARLCEYIATKIPYKEKGGRTGNKLYIELTEKKDDTGYGWVARHTWQSWRERYKKNASRLDVIINALVERDKPTIGESGQYGFIRQPEAKAKKPRKKPVKTLDGQGFAHIQFVSDPGPSHQFIPQQGNVVIDPALMNEPTGRNGHAHAQAMEDDSVTEEDEEEEWVIRVGNAPVPEWAKRKASPDREVDNRPLKRHRDHSASSSSTAYSSAVLDIAKEFRFTSREVQDYFDKCGGSQTKTRKRFRMARALVDKLEDSD